MASKAKKEKAPKVAIGDQIILECARWREYHGISCSLREFLGSDIMRVKSLITSGLIEKTDSVHYTITDAGTAYVERNFPDFYSKKEKERSHGK